MVADGRSGDQAPQSGARPARPLTLRLVLTLMLMPMATGPARAALPLPEYIEKCPMSEPVQLSRCVVDKANQALPYVLKGHRKYGVPPLDPMHVDRIAYNHGSFSVVFTDVRIFGGKNAVFTSADANLKEGRLEMNFTMPEAEFRAKYAIDGRILILPVQGRGDCRIRFFNVSATYGAKQKTYTKDDGLEYIDIVDPYFSFEVDNLTVQFDNLFNGDKNLGKATNQFLNENWKDIYDETKEGAFRAMNAVLTSTLQGLASVVPYREIYPVE